MPRFQDGSIGKDPAMPSTTGFVKAGLVHRGCLTSVEKIDICRGVFAFLVVVAHALDIAWAIHPDAPARLPEWQHHLLLYVVGAGIYWVIGFFVISGYCIQLSVERQTEDGEFPLGHYLTARLTRILPLYYAALLTAVACEWLMGPARPLCWPHGLNAGTLAAQLLVIQNLTQTYGSFAPSWSITNEMFYYLMYGGIVALGRKGGLRPAVWGAVLFGTLALVLDVVYFAGWRSGVVRSPGLLFGLGFIWFQGVLVAEYRETLRGSWIAAAGSRFWPLVLALAMVLWLSRRVHLQVVYLVLGAAFTLMLIRFVAADASARATAPRRDRQAAWIRMLGLSSYPTYLFHGPIVMLVGSILTRFGLTSDWRITWLVLASIGISSGITLGYLAEAPLMAWRAIFLKRLGGAPSRSDRCLAPTAAPPSPTAVLGT